CRSGPRTAPPRTRLDHRSPHCAWMVLLALATCKPYAVGNRRFVCTALHELRMRAGRDGPWASAVSGDELLQLALDRVADVAVGAVERRAPDRARQREEACSPHARELLAVERADGFAMQLKAFRRLGLHGLLLLKC